MESIYDIREQVPYNGKEDLLVQDHTTNDIVKAIKKYHGKYCKDYDKISKEFWDKDPEDTGKRIFVFLKKNIRYDIEPENYQTVKSPGAIVQQRHGDCKHYASFITGICCSLERQGYPIHARYRFVSDNKDREIHHVFAVITDKETGTQYWVDPVLNRFNEQPKFYNVKDADMSSIGELYSISGLGDYGAEDTYPGGPRNLPQVGKKKKKGNIFKKIAHGFAVNAHNAAKGIKAVAQDVKNLTLKVSLAAARGPFLALVDFNMFNLAKHLHETLNSPEAGKLLSEWKKLGGSDNALKSAVNNGVKNYNKHHGAKIKGFNAAMGNIHDVARHHGLRHYHHPHLGPLPIDQMSLLQHPPHTTFPWKVHHLPRTMRGVDSSVIACGCSGNAIGCLPVCAPALMALAAGIIAALSKFIKSTPAEKAEMAGHAAAGVSNLVTDVSNGIDAENGDLGPAVQDAQNLASGGPGINMSAGEDPDTGDPVLQVHSVDHPIVNQAGAPISDDDIDPDASDPKKAGEHGTKGAKNPNDLINVPSHVATDVMRDVIGPIKDEVGKIWASYKMPIMLLGGGYVAYKVYSNRRRKPVRRK